MNVDDYITQRVNDQIDWYDKKSTSNKRAFLFLRVFEVLSASLVVLLSGMSGDSGNYSICIAVLSMLIAVSAALLGIFKFQENWISYRTTSEQLKHEKFLFITSSGPYENCSAQDFVARIESLISKENSAWSSHVRKKA